MINKNNKFYDLFQSKGKRHFKNIFLVNKKKFHYGWGSYLFNGKKYLYDKSMYKKQKLLFDLSKKNNKILEIGVYMGHSILIMLLANPKVNITAIDVSDTYSKPSINYLKIFLTMITNFLNFNCNLKYRNVPSNLQLVF
jgi:tRNA G46 methylase TrmB